MATSLTGIGILWAFLSLVSAIACCTGFYLPYWIKGELTQDFDTYFGSFRRCNYPVLNERNQIELLKACGRYSTYADIPSPWWQATTVLVGLGSGLALLLAVTATAACCIAYLIHGRMAKIVGVFQFLSAVLIAVGLALYPMGWDNIEVLQACGGVSKAYHLGLCELYHSMHLMMGGTALLFVCSTLSCKASRLKPGSFRWKRSAECRLCECPAADAGVRMDQLDAGKLSEWWLQKLGVALDLEDIAQQWICQFCLFDAKLEHEYSESEHQRFSTSCDWWTGFDSNALFFNNYYQDGSIQRCSVVMPPRRRQIASSIFVKTCIYCKVTFCNKTEAFLHAGRDHKDIDMFKCYLCKMCFFSKTELHTHNKEFHNNFSKICVYCSSEKRFYSRGNLLKHVKVHHKTDTIIQCARAHCKVFFKTQIEKVEHENNVHASKAIDVECKFCKVRVLRPHLNEHMQKFHNRGHYTDFHQGEQTTCCYCREIFPSKSATMRHVKNSHSDIKTFVCFSCTIYFPNLTQKQDHYQRVHRGNFPCIYCNLSFAYNQNLHRHMREKHDGQLFQCKYKSRCARYFKTNDDLEKHIEEYHVSDKSSKVQCMYCQKLTLHEYYQRHIKNNHKQVAIKCNFNTHCPVHFLTKDDREKHILAVHHTGKLVENLKCSHCDNEYGHFCNLRSHNLKVHGLTLLKCSKRKCGYITDSRVQFDQHSQEKHGLDEERKIFKCKLCDFKSKNIKGLEQHTLHKHGSENKQCSLCPSKYFKSDYALNCHVKRLHPKNPKVCIHCKLPVRYLADHLRQRPCKVCNKILPCTEFKRKHVNKCKGRI